MRSTICATSPVPTISVRRGLMIAGRSQLRTDPRVSSTSGSAVARNIAASTGKNTSASMTRRSTWLRIRKNSDPAISAWKSSPTSSNVASEMLRFWRS